MRLPPYICLSAAALLLVSACGPSQSGGAGSPGDSASSETTLRPIAPSPSGSTLLPDQLGACVGAIPSDTTTWPALAASDTVTAGVVCQESTQRVPGDGEWKVRTVANLMGPQLAALVQALRTPDAPPPAGAACPAIGYVIPPWALTLDDGKHVQPQIPNDGCAPSKAVRDLLYAAVKDPAATITRIAHARGEAEVASGCGDGLKDIVWRDKPDLSVTVVSAPQKDDAIAVCVSTRDTTDTMTDGLGAVSYVLRLSATGQSTGAAVTHLFSSIKPGAWPADCRGKAATSMVGIQRLPASLEQPNTILYAEIGGCSRVMTGELQPVGTADATAIATVAALAAQPVQRH
ncbi:MAG: hypothetical protein QOG52_2680 [Frankiaceae bacterium]|nr:hypothetical protein [Frankiaceae bacterium]